MIGAQKSGYQVFLQSKKELLVTSQNRNSRRNQSKRLSIFLLPS